jgi:TolA-binding protein
MSTPTPWKAQPPETLSSSEQSAAELFRRALEPNPLSAEALRRVEAALPRPVRPRKIAPLFLMRGTMAALLLGGAGWVFASPVFAPLRAQVVAWFHTATDGLGEARRGSSSSSSASAHPLESQTGAPARTDPLSEEVSSPEPTSPETTQRMTSPLPEAVPNDEVRDSPRPVREPFRRRGRSLEPGVAPTQTPASSGVASQAVSTKTDAVAAPPSLPELAAQGGGVSPPAPPSALALEARSLAQALRLLRQEDKPRAALSLLDSHLAKHSEGPLAQEARLARVEVYVRLDQPTEALRALDDVSAHRAISPVESAWVLRQELLARQGTCVPALAGFDDTLAQPRLSSDLRGRALYGAAVCLSQLGKTTEARARFEQYLREFPGGPLAAATRKALRLR